MADWVGGLVQLAQTGAALLAQKEAQSHRRKQETGDLRRKKARAWEDLEIQQPRDRQSFAANALMAQGQALGAPGAGALRGAVNLQRGQREDREDLARKGGRLDEDLDIGLKRYEDEHATDYLKALGSAAGAIGTTLKSPSYDAMPEAGLPEDAKLSTQLPAAPQGAAAVNAKPIWSGADAGRYDPFSDEEFLKSMGRW